MNQTQEQANESQTKSVEQKLIASEEKRVMSPTETRRNELKSLLITNKDQLAMALPRHMNADTLIRVALTAINKTPKLLECTVPSIIGSILQSAQLGLMPDGAVGEGYLLPFKNNKKRDNRGNPVMECQFMIGYRGFITLAYRSGQVSSFQARAVYAADKFEYEFGLEEKLVHKPIESGNRGELTYVYAVVKLVNGGYVFDVMNREEVEHIRRMSKAPNSDAWVNSYPEMAIKTVIRRIAKRTPLSPEFVRAANLDEQVEISGISQNSSALLYGTDSEQFSEVIEVEEKEIHSIEEAEEKKTEVAKKTGKAAVQTAIDLMNQKK